MLLFFVVCGIGPIKILLFAVAAVYIVPYLRYSFMGHALLALLVIGTA